MIEHPDGGRDVIEHPDGGRDVIEHPDGGGDVIELDCRGQKCPLPVIALARRIREAGVGEVVRVLADDPAAANDIPAWCRMKEQEYLGSPQTHAHDVRRIS